jgi:hypothetical protein
VNSRHSPGRGLGKKNDGRNDGVERRLIDSSKKKSCSRVKS